MGSSFFVISAFRRSPCQDPYEKAGCRIGGSGGLTTSPHQVPENGGAPNTVVPNTKSSCVRSVRKEVACRKKEEHGLLLLCDLRISAKPLPRSVRKSRVQDTRGPVVSSPPLKRRPENDG